MTIELNNATLHYMKGKSRIKRRIHLNLAGDTEDDKKLFGWFETELMPTNAEGDSMRDWFKLRGDRKHPLENAYRYLENILKEAPEPYKMEVEKLDNLFVQNNLINPVKFAYLILKGQVPTLKKIVIERWQYVMIEPDKMWS